jgi:hypothetical protein
MKDDKQECYYLERGRRVKEKGRARADKQDEAKKAANLVDGGHPDDTADNNKNGSESLPCLHFD